MVDPNGLMENIYIFGGFGASKGLGLQDPGWRHFTPEQFTVYLALSTRQNCVDLIEGEFSLKSSPQIVHESHTNALAPKLFCTDFNS